VNNQEPQESEDFFDGPLTSMDPYDLMSIGLAGFGTLNRNPDDGIVLRLACPACKLEHEFRSAYDDVHEGHSIQFDWKCQGRAFRTPIMGFSKPVNMNVSVPFFRPGTARAKANAHLN
jgi:hypothetical protein